MERKKTNTIVLAALLGTTIRPITAEEQAAAILIQRIYRRYIKSK